MTWFFLLFAGLGGAILGSFLNALIWRLHEGLSLWGWSMCPHCRTRIRPRHLVPVISWLWLRGRCAECKTRIHIQYPAVEVAAALIVVISLLRHPGLGGVSPFLFESFFGLNLLFLAVFDWRYRVLPMEWMVICGGILGVWAVAQGSLTVTQAAIGVLVPVLFFGAQVVLSRGAWMGAGDPWLGAVIGAALGWPTILFAIYAAYVGGGVLLLPFIIAKKIDRKSRVPFGPMLVFGAFLALWFFPWMQAWLNRW